MCHYESGPLKRVKGIHEILLGCHSLWQPVRLMEEISNEDEQQEPFLKCQPKATAVLMWSKSNERPPGGISGDLTTHICNDLGFTKLFVFRKETV